MALGKKFQQFWEKERSLTILLIILTIHIFIIIPISEKTLWSQVIFYIFYMLILSAGMLILTKRILLRIILLLALFVMVTIGSGLFFWSPSLEIISDLAIVLYCILLIWVVLLQTFKEGPVTIHRIQGSVVVYLLVGFIFGILYHTICTIDEGRSFQGLNFSDRKELMYFSMVTLTTVGYGDITPAVPLTRSLTTLEALIGQLYPAILIARLVSMEFSSSKRNRDNRQEE